MNNSYFFIDDAKTFGGAQVALLNTIEALKNSKKCKVELMIARENLELISRLEFTDKNSIQFCPGALPSNIFAFIFHTIWFIKFFHKKTDRDECIYIANLSGIEFCIAPSIVLRLYNRKVHGWIHNTSRLDNLMPDAGFFRKKFYTIRDEIAEQLVFRLYESFLTPTKAAANLLRKRIGSTKPTHHIFNVSTNESRNQPGRCTAKKPIHDDKSLSIAIIGRIEFSTKGQDKSIELVNAFNKIGIKVKIIIVGDGPDRSRLEKMFEAQNLRESLNIVGWQKNVTPYIDSSDVVLIPSRHESFSLVVVETMNRLKPLVSSNLSCFQELLPDDFICHTDSTPEYLEKILKVIKLPPHQLQSKYKPSLEMCSEERFIDRFLQLTSEKFEHNEKLF